MSDIADRPPSFTLTKRKLAEIDHVLRNLTFESTIVLPPKPGNSHMTRIEIVIVFAVLAGLLLVTALAVVLNPIGFKRLKTYWRTVLRKQDRDNKAVSEKLEVGIDSQSSFDDGTTSGFQPYHGGLHRRARLTPAAPGDIWSAAIRGDLHAVETFLSQDKDFDANNAHPRYGSILTAAARSGNALLVQRLIVVGTDPCQNGGDYHNPLQAAAHSGNIDTIRLLLERSAKDTSIGGFYGTALNAAAEKGDVDMVQTLLENYPQPAAIINARGGSHGRSIIAAAFRGQSAMALTLLKHGADPNATNETGMSALHAAAAGNWLEIVQLLLQWKANPSLVSSIHCTALHAASSAGHETVALALISSGADPHIRDQNSKIPLHEASKNGLSTLVEALLAGDASEVNAQDESGNTPLHHAAIGGHIDVTITLLKFGADVAIGDKYNAQPLFRAAGCHHADVVDVLLQAGAEPNARDRFGQIALHGPSETDDVRVQELLINAKADINALGAWNRTPLYESCNMGKFKNVELLLQQPGIIVNPIDDHHGTPICRSLCSTDPRHQNQCVNPDIALLMVERQDLDVNLCNGLAVQEAAKLGMEQLFRRMVTERNANIHVQGGKYGGVLQAAAIGGNLDIINMLLERKANVNQQGGEWGNPLAAACAYGHVLVVKELLNRGADAKARGGRYGSAFASIGKIEVEDRGRYEKDDIMRDIQLLLLDAGEDGGAPVEQPNLTDRWHDTTAGWRWIAKGEM